MVVEIPPAGDDGSLNGNFVTLWQTALEDAGLLGVDKGKGVKLVITPPGYAGKIPHGFEQLASDTYGGYFLIRSNLKSHERRRRAEIDRLWQAGEVLPAVRRSTIRRRQSFIDVKDKDFDSTIKYDASFFALLDRVVQSRALDRSRPGDDRPAPDHRHREGQAVRTRRCDEASARSGRRRRRRRCLRRATTPASRRSSRARTG